MKKLLLRVGRGRKEPSARQLQQLLIKWQRAREDLVYILLKGQHKLENEELMSESEKRRLKRSNKTKQRKLPIRHLQRE